MDSGCVSADIWAPAQAKSTFLRWGVDGAHFRFGSPSSGTQNPVCFRRLLLWSGMSFLKTDSKNSGAVPSGTALLRFALVLALLVSGVLSYWASVANEQVELPGIASALRVETYADDATSPEHIIDDLSRLAEEERGSIYVEIPSLEGRTAYVAGKHARAWLEDGYRGLPGATAVDIRPFSDLPHKDYRQVLEVSGGSGFVGSVENYLQQHGIGNKALSSQRWAFLFAGTSLASAAQLLLGFCFGLSLLGIMLNSRNDAVRRLHGYTLIRSCWYELRQASRRALVPAIGVLIAINIALGLWVSPVSYLQWLKYQALFTLVALAACVIAVIFTLFLLRRATIGALLRGQLPGKSILAGTYIVRIGALVAVASMGIGAINYSAEWWKQRSEVPLWQDTPEAYSVEISGARDLEGINEASTVLAGRLRELSAEGRLLFAQYIDAARIRDNAVDRDIMIYNAAAANISLQGPALTAYQENAQKQQPLWLQPDDVAGEVNVERIQRSLQAEGSWQKQSYPSGQTTAKTWEAGGSEWMNRSSIKDPLILILPNAALQLSDRNVVATLTQGDILLTDYEDFHSLQADPKLGSFIRSAAPIAQEWARNHQTMGTTIWIYVGGLLAAVLLTLIAAAAVLFSSLRIFHQKLRANYIHGLLPREPLAILAAAETIVVVFMISYLWNRGAPVRQWTAGGDLAGSADPSLIAMFSIPTSIWWVALGLTLLTTAPAMMFWLRRYSAHQLIESRR